MRHVISMLLQNESGALSRVASMFSTRGFNIESLNVAPTEDEAVSRVTLVTSGTDAVVQQINKQLGKLIDVVAIADRTSVDHFERELGIVKLRLDATGPEAIESLLTANDAKILDPEHDHFTIELSADEAAIDAFLDSLPDGVHILSLVRSGPLVMARGPHTLLT